MAVLCPSEVVLRVLSVCRVGVGLRMISVEKRVDNTNFVQRELAPRRCC